MLELNMVVKYYDDYRHQNYQLVIHLVLMATIDLVKIQYLNNHLPTIQYHFVKQHKNENVQEFHQQLVDDMVHPQYHLLYLKMENLHGML